MTDRGREVLRERETRVFARAEDGRWLGVHEHLSPAPESPAPEPPAPEPAAP